MTATTALQDARGLRGSTAAERDVPRSVRLRFGSDRARPVVTSVYQPAQGWTEPSRRARLTHGVIDQLLAEGITMVEAAWRFRTVRLSLLRLHKPAGAGRS